MQPIAGEPFPGSSSKVPRHVELIRSAFSLEDDPAAMIGVSRRECVDMLAAGKEDELLDVIFTRYEAYRSRKDIVLVEGTHSGRTPPATLNVHPGVHASLQHFYLPQAGLLMKESTLSVSNTYCHYL